MSQTTEEQNEIEERPQHSATYRVENMVVSVALDIELPLKRITDSDPDAKPNKNNFPGIVIKTQRPKCTVLVFKKGKLVFTGLKKLPEADEVLAIILDKFKAVDVHVDHKPSMKLVNVVVSIDFKHRINLDTASLLLDSSLYEPEIFPGLIHRVESPHKAVFLIFSSGKSVLTGLKEEDEIIPSIVAIGKKLKNNGLLDGKDLDDGELLDDDEIFQ